MWILRNISKKESILFGLLGVSLTTVGATLLYELYRKDNDRIFSRKRKSTCQITSIEFKVPNSSIAAIIGKGGRMIREIEMKTGVTISIQKYSKSKTSDPTDRICVITGPAESVKLAQIIIQNIIDNVPVIDTYECYMPYKVVRHILGKGRQNLQKVQEASNAKVIIDDSDLEFKSFCHPANYSYGDLSKHGKKRIIVHGTVEQIKVALGLIEQIVQQEDGVDVVLEDLCPIKVPGAYTKLLTDELRKGSAFSKIILSPLPLDDAMEVYVSAMETPGQFWIQIIGPGVTYLDSLMYQMSRYYDMEENRPLHILKEITVGQVVAAKCTYSEQWYRAEVTKILEKSQYEVFLLDYGIFIQCTTEDLLELRTDMLSLRLQAVECKLANIKPKKGEWSAYACKEFATCAWLGHSRPIHATVKGYVQRPADYRRPMRSDAVVLCIELFDVCQDTTITQTLVSLGLAEFDEDVHSKVTDVATNIMKRQFLSVPLKTKTVCLTPYAKESENNSTSSLTNIHNSIASESEESNLSTIEINLSALIDNYDIDCVLQHVDKTKVRSVLDANKYNTQHKSKLDDITMSAEEHSDIVSERKNEAEMSTLTTDENYAETELDNITTLEEEDSDIILQRKNEVEISTLDANKNDVKLESKPDNVTTSVEKHSVIVAERKNEAEISTLNDNDDAQPESKPSNIITSVEEHSDIVPERKNEAEISTLNANKNDAKLESKPDNITTSVEEHSVIIVAERKNEVEISTLNDNDDVQPESKPSNIITSVEEHSDIVSERENGAEISTLDANKNDAKLESKPDNITTSVEKHSVIVAERKNEAKISTLNDNDDAQPESKPSNIITSVEEHSDIVPERKNEAEISTLNANKNGAKLESKPDNITTSVEEHSVIVAEPKNEPDISTLDKSEDDAKSDSHLVYLPALDS